MKIAGATVFALALVAGYGFFQTRDLDGEYARQAELQARESPAAAKRRAEARLQDLMKASHGPLADLEQTARELPKIDPDVRLAWITDGGVPAYDARDAVLVSSPVRVEGRSMTVGLAYLDHELPGDLARTEDDRHAATRSLWRTLAVAALALLIAGAIAIAIGRLRRRA